MRPWIALVATLCLCPLWSSAPAAGQEPQPRDMPPILLVTDGFEGSEPLPQGTRLALLEDDPTGTPRRPPGVSLLLATDPLLSHWELKSARFISGLPPGRPLPDSIFVRYFLQVRDPTDDRLLYESRLVVRNERRTEWRDPESGEWRGHRSFPDEWLVHLRVPTAPPRVRIDLFFRPGPSREAQLMRSIDLDLEDSR
jgi:hypothetical protein